MLASEVVARLQELIAEQGDAVLVLNEFDFLQYEYVLSSVSDIFMNYIGMNNEPTKAFIIE